MLFSSCGNAQKPIAGHNDGGLKDAVTSAPAAVRPETPRFAVFAGDTILLTRADLRERMDREILAFSYMHSNSLLMIRRANRIFPQVEPVLKECGVPDDLKYLMVIESNLDPKSVSSAGAAGLWQFMKGAGAEYGLVIDSEVDERYNTEKATRAACKYLKYAYSKFHDWMTVAASYNSGTSGISRRLEEQNQTTALDLWLNEETSRYMFRLLVAKMFMENPQSFGFTFTREELYPYIPPKRTVEVSGPIEDLAGFAAGYGVSYADLKRENLWLRDKKLVNKLHRKYHIAIPDVEAQYYDPSRTAVHCKVWIGE